MAQLRSASNNRWTQAGICALIAVLVGIVFGQTLHFQFVNFDDNSYVFENTAVQRGLTSDNFIWAFTHVVSSNWHPLTMLSHMLDCQFYGLNAGGHHFTNIALHALVAMLLFLVLQQMTNKIRAAAFVAMVFAIHPLRVESVAWIAERKDVLSGIFFMLTIGAYIHYARHPWSLARYLAVTVVFALGFLCKPMLVTLPLVLLLLDYWPLNRISNFKIESPNAKATPNTATASKSLTKLIVEKIPLFLLSAALCVTTLLVQDKARQAAQSISLSTRIGNAFVSCATYLGQLFYPANLAVFYPFPANGWEPWRIGLSVVILIAISAAVFHWRKKRPYLLVGWLWYLIMLVPVIGIVQVGTQARADRYTYLPEIGLCVALTWLLVDVTTSWRNRKTVLGTGATALVIALTIVAHAQVAFWRDSETLWTHTIACTSSNAIAESNLANYLLHQGRFDDAIYHSKAALQISPDYPDALNCLGYTYFQEGRMDEAIPQLEHALQVEPDFAAAHNSYGLALLQSGHATDAVVQFQLAVKLQPDQADARNNLGIALLRTGQTAAAAAEYQQAIQLNPNFPNANNNLAWLLSTSPNAAFRDGLRAIPLALRANKLSDGNNLIVLRTLAAAYAEAGRFPDAVQTAGKALQLATSQSRGPWINTLRSDIGLYQAGQPLRDSAH